MSFLNNRIIWSSLLSKKAWKKAKSQEATALVRRKLLANSCDLLHLTYILKAGVDIYMESKKKKMVMKNLGAGQE